MTTITQHVLVHNVENNIWRREPIHVKDLNVVPKMEDLLWIVSLPITRTVAGKKVPIDHCSLPMCLRARDAFRGQPRTVRSRSHVH